MYLCQHEWCMFLLEAVTWKTNLLSSYLASMESKQGEANLKTYTSLIHEARAHFPSSGTVPASRVCCCLFPSHLALAKHCHLLQLYDQPTWPQSRISAHWFLLLLPLTVKVLKGAHQLLPRSNYKTQQSCWDALPIPPYLSFTP